MVVCQACLKRFDEVVHGMRDGVLYCPECGHEVLRQVRSRSEHGAAAHLTAEEMRAFIGRGIGASTGMRATVVALDEIARLGLSLGGVP